MATMHKHSPKDMSISDALKLVDDYAKEKGSDIRDMISDQYTNIKDAVEGKASNLSYLFEDAAGKAKKYAKVGREKTRELIDETEKQMKRNPWAFIGAVALGAFALGFLMKGRD